MHLLTLIVTVVLLPAAYTLTCYQCVPGASGTCTNTTKVCPLRGHLCRAVRITSYAGNSKLADVNIKTCATEEQCVEGSLNYGLSRTIFTSRCCASDLCNIHNAPEPSHSSHNGKKCYGCDGHTCRKTLHCNGDEDHCIKTTVSVGGEVKTQKGCASKQMCSSTGNAQISGIIAGESTCCEGDFCNGASGTTAGLLILAAPLLAMVMFS